MTKLIKIPEAAKILRVSEHTLRKYIQKGEIKCIRLGNHSGKGPERRPIRFTGQHLSEFCDAGPDTSFSKDILKQIFQ